MGYFITGATGFIGRHLVVALARARGAHLDLAEAGLARQVRPAGAGLGRCRQSVVPVEGDLQQALLGVSARDRGGLRGHVLTFSIWAPCTIWARRTGSRERQRARHPQCARLRARDPGRLLSSRQLDRGPPAAIAARSPKICSPKPRASIIPYFRTKHESEALVRTTCRPWRVYRPGMVVGHSRSGVTDKIDGPHYLFKAIQKLRDICRAGYR